MPSPPTGLTATAVSSSEIDLAWDNDDLLLAIGQTWEIGWGTSSSAGDPPFLIPGVNGAYHDTGLPPSTTYYYKVRFNDNGSVSGWSNEASATTQSGSLATTLSLDDIREAARVRYGNARRVYFVNADDGVDTNSGERPTESLATVWKAIQLRSAQTGSAAIIFDGLQSLTTDNANLYDTGIPGFDRRNILVPANTQLIGSGVSTAKIWADGNGTAAAHVVSAAGDDVVMENFSIRSTADPTAFHLLFGFHSGYAGTPATKRVRVRNVVVDGYSDGAYYYTQTAGEVADWIVTDSVFRTNYDAHTILGASNAASPDCRIVYRNCDFIVRGPATTSPFNICRAVTANNGTAIFENCRLITETTSNTTTVLACVYARAGTGTTSRIELYNCNVQTKVQSGYAGTEHHLRTDTGCTIRAHNVFHDISKNSDADGSGLSYINDTGESQALRILQSSV